MDIAHDLNQSFIRQAFTQIETLARENLNIKYKKNYQHRLFRYNIFEDVGVRRKKYLEQVLRQILIALGNELNSSLDKSSEGPMVVDRATKLNFMYDKHGVIYLKPKKSVRFQMMGMKKQAFFLHIVTMVIKLIDRCQYISKREMYYLSLPFSQIILKGSNSTTSQSQQATSQSQHSGVPSVRHSPTKLEIIIDDLCCLIGCSRVHLHILTQPKGLVYGNLKFRLRSGVSFDCLEKKEGVMLPTAQEPITHVESDAKFILVLEKDCVLQKILNQEEVTNFVRDYKVILFTAKGYPDLTSKAFLNFISSKLQVPVLALTDADPHGLEIVCSYKYGNYCTAYEAPYVVLPQMKWLGLLPSDVKKLGIDHSKTVALSKNDMRKINSLLARPYIANNLGWVRQMHTMKESGRKAELESLDATGEFLVGTYLPNKLRYASWL